MYSSAYGPPLLTPAQSGRLRIQDRRKNALEALRQGKDRVGYVGDEVCEEDRPNPDIVTNQWSLAESHYECHHTDCVVVGTAWFYFVTEEEFLVHWNAFHAAVSPWYVCPAQGCEFLVPGEPDAFDCYMMHVQRRHVAHGEAGELEQESARTSEDSTRWGINPCCRYVELGDRYPPRRKALVEVPFNEPVIGSQWIARQQMNSLHKRGFPDAKFLDHQPYWGECKTRTRGGTSYKHQRKKEVRRQRKEEERLREEEVACYSPTSSGSRAAEQITQAARLRLVTGMVKPPLPCGGVAPSAALTFEDALVEEGKEEPKYWMYARVMAQSFCVGRSIVAYCALPLMRSDRRPAGWDEWGRPWALMDIAKRDIPTNQEVWHRPHTKGRALVAVLVRYDEQLYYFSDAPALLKALHRSARAEGVMAAQPGTQGWSALELKRVEQLLRPHTYPPCGVVLACLRKWPQFAHRGDGYREGPPMPGGPEPVVFRSEDWDPPEPIVPPVPAGRWRERPAEEEAKAPEGPRPDSGSEGTLRERWQATHVRDPPAWADKGFAGIKEHMKQQAAAAKGTSEEEVTVYCPPQNLTPRQQMRALLDPQLPGEQVPAGRSWRYEDDQAIPDYALPRFRGNPKDNYQVMSPGHVTSPRESAGVLDEGTPESALGGRR